MVSDYQKEGQIVDSTIQTKQSPIQSTLSVPDHCVHDKPSSRQIQMGLEASITVDTDVKIDACKAAFGTLNAESGLSTGPLLFLMTVNQKQEEHVKTKHHSPVVSCVLKQFAR